MAIVVSYMKSCLIDGIKIHYANDNAFDLPFEIYLKKLRSIKEIEQFESYDLRNYILYYNARVCIAKVENYRHDIMHDLHDIPIASHLGFQMTYMIIRCHYYWPRMKRDIREYVERYLYSQVF